MSDARDPIPVATWYIDAGRPLEALDALRGGDPNDPRVACLRGHALGAIGRTEEAERELRRGLAIDPENVPLLHALGTLQWAVDPNAAEVTVRRGLALDGENPRLLGLYVLILLQQERFEWAEKMLERTMRAAPDDVSTLRIRTLFMMRASSSAKVRAAAHELLRHYPDDAYAHYLQGLALLDLRFRRGFRHLRAAAALRPQDPLIVETARVMSAWYLWPTYATAPPVHYVITSALGLVIFAGWLWLKDSSVEWFGVAATVLFQGYKWAVFFIARSTLNARVTRALSEQASGVASSPPDA